MHHKLKVLPYQRATRQIRSQQRGHESQSAYTYYMVRHILLRKEQRTCNTPIARLALFMLRLTSSPARTRGLNVNPHTGNATHVTAREQEGSTRPQSFWLRFQLTKSSSERSK